MKLRLHQYLSKSGIFKSKKELIDSIRNGEIEIEGKIITNPHFQFGKDKEVKYKGTKLKIEEKKYFILNKPAGYLSSRLTKNDTGKKSVFDLVENDNSLVCVGRLDEGTSGLLIITNDGDLVHKITLPDKNIRKCYEAELESSLKNEKDIEKGVEIELEENGHIHKYMTKPCKVQKISEKKAVITITEGKKREVRRIFEKTGNKVIKLKRISIGNISLEKLGLSEGKSLKVDKEFIEKNL
jgi:pseudouridine synthase